MALPFISTAKIPGIITILLLFLTHSCSSYSVPSTITPGNRLKNIPNPDFTHTKILPNNKGIGEYQINHTLNGLPFDVRVYAIKDGSVHEGGGGLLNDGHDSTDPASGLIFAYNETFVKIWTPVGGKVVSPMLLNKDDGRERVRHNVSNNDVVIVVQVWRSGPLPTKEFKLTSDKITSGNKDQFLFQHSLQQTPDQLSVRVSPIGGGKSIRGFSFHAISPSIISSSTKTVGGVIVAYNSSHIKLSIPRRRKRFCIFLSKKWASRSVYVRSCTFHVRFWVGSFPPPMLQYDWLTLDHSDHEFVHNLKALPSLVIVEARRNGQQGALIFQGVGTIQSNNSLSHQQRPSVAYTYDNKTVRIFQAGAPGKLEVRVKIFVNRCDKMGEYWDSQGHCRSVQYIERDRGCQGRRMQNVINCDFSMGMCGFSSNNFSRIPCQNMATEEMDEGRNCEFLKNGSMGNQRRYFSEITQRQSSFVFSIPDMKFTSGGPTPLIHKHNVLSVPRTAALLESKDLGGKSGCVLAFKYTALRRYGVLSVDVLPQTTCLNCSVCLTDEKWITDVWVIRGDEHPEPDGRWYDGYVDLHHHLQHHSDDGKTIKIKKLRFVQKVWISASGNIKIVQEVVDSVLITNVTLRCASEDFEEMNRSTCDGKKFYYGSSCVANALLPYYKGPAYSLYHHKQTHSNSTPSGMFVMANGTLNETIAVYMFHLDTSGHYYIWIESFAHNNTQNNVTIEVNGKRVSTKLWYHANHSQWGPVNHMFELDAGIVEIKLIQVEFHFRFRNIIIVPKTIQVWYSLGMQSLLIPDSSFRLIGDEIAEEGEMNKCLHNDKSECIHARLHHNGGWIPTTPSNDIYLEIQFPEIALINKIAAQGADDFLTAHNRSFHLQGFTMKFSLDSDLHHSRSFSFYRKHIHGYPHVFPGTSDIHEVKEYTLEYTVVARAVRIHPNFPREKIEKGVIDLGMRMEFYGYYMIKGMCPKIVKKLKKKERNCTSGGRNETINYPEESGGLPMRSIVIGIASFGGVFTLLLILFIFRRTRRTMPAPFTKVRRESDEMELLPTSDRKQDHQVFAFENPYYDVIAAMELDDDFEEDYHNPAFYENRIPQGFRVSGLHDEEEDEDEDENFFLLRRPTNESVDSQLLSSSDITDKDSGISSTTHST